MAVYLDHNASTPLSPAALAAMTDCLREGYGNPSSIHAIGQRAKQLLEHARRQVAQSALCRPDEVIFTSGATEANNLALFGVARATGKRHVVTTAIEHPAVLNPACELDATVVPVDGDGLVDPDAIARAMRPDTALVSVMAVNNELGVIQPIEAIAAIARERGVLFHTDAVQALGKIPFEVTREADLVSISAHKVYGPKGAGALIARKGTAISKIQFGGHHERDRRAGTENVPACVGFGAACADLRLDPALMELRDGFEQRLIEEIEDVRVNSASAPRAVNTSNILIEGIEGEALVIGLDLKGFAISSGAACSSGAVEPSHVLTAIGLTREQARSSIRVSLGRGNTSEHMEEFVQALAAVTARLRKLSPAYA
jgi:cysteine desulfurase